VRKSPRGTARERWQGARQTAQEDQGKAGSDSSQQEEPQAYVDGQGLDAGVPLPPMKIGISATFKIERPG
jgi:hypothetical protein